jgi:hypothetical protein
LVVNISVLNIIANPFLVCFVVRQGLLLSSGGLLRKQDRVDDGGRDSRSHGSGRLGNRLLNSNVLTRLSDTLGDTVTRLLHTKPNTSTRLQTPHL